jgi:hypothetical protein
MAIKGKGKTRGRQPARAPRRAPVEVKPPFFLRRRVQVSAAFIAGLLLMVGVVWVTNGIRSQHADNEAAAEASAQRSAGQKWKSQVEGALGKVGTVSSSGTPPVLFSTVSDAITALQKGNDPAGGAASLKDARASATLAIDPLQSYDLVGQVAGKGMGKGQAEWFLNSKTRIVESLELYRQAAALAGLAFDASGDQRAALADRASDVQASAAQILQDGWQDYKNALASVQIIETPSLTGLTGPPGSSG